MDVFRRAHPEPRVVMVGLDVRWCVTGDTYQKLTPRVFPAWMYQRDRWAGYLHMFNLYAVQEAGQQFGILLGIKRPVYGRDGYTQLRAAGQHVRSGARRGASARRRRPIFRPVARSGPASERGAIRRWRRCMRSWTHSRHATRKILFFVPYNHVLFSPAGSEGAGFGTNASGGWPRLRQRCPGRWRSISCAPARSPRAIRTTGIRCITASAVADRLVRDLAAGGDTPDSRLLSAEGAEASR